MLRFTENRRSSGLSVTTNPRTAMSAHGLVEATQSQAEGGTVTGRYMSPLRVAQYVAKLLQSALGITSGQIAFPATQNPSSDVNTLDDYEEGIWTPVLTFATPGNLSVVYSTQVGQYTKIGNTVTVWFTIVTSTFTHTTASGNFNITGLPFTVNATLSARGVMNWQGITKANYTQVNPVAGASNTILTAMASGSGQSNSNIVPADMPSAGSVFLAGSVTYQV